jgi:hypothetical protein
VGVALGFSVASFPKPGVFAARAQARVAVETEPAGAQVIVDGVLRGESPITVDLPSGERVLSVSRAGATRDVVLRLGPGDDAAWFFKLGVGAPAPTAGPALGSLEVETRPAGARVLIAGQQRGVTPTTIARLEPGPVDVTLSTSERTITQRVQIQGGRRALLVVPMRLAAAPSYGWIAVRADVPMRILEGGKVIGTTESDRIMLPAGRHALELVNEGLEVRLGRVIAVQGGRELSLTVPVPSGRLSINAQPWAEVWVGSARLGETPLGNVSLPVGQHEVVFRHPQLGERRQTVTVRASTPTRVTALFAPQ